MPKIEAIGKTPEQLKIGFLQLGYYFSFISLFFQQL